MSDMELQFDQGNQQVSPVLKEGKKNILIDIDGTICEDVPNEQPERMKHAKPYHGAREVINRWFKEGHIITFFTSREEQAHREITTHWLEEHGFNYHHLLMNKPRGGRYHWIDNHLVESTRYEGNWSSIAEEFVQ